MKKKINHEYPLISITWADHYSEFDDGFTLDEIKKLLDTPCIRETGGYLVGENKRQIAIAGTIEEDGTMSEVFICMKKAIIHRSDKDDTTN